ncbi:UdgX family uracil-DNA binding protein [Pontivivens ytuae]|uniref:Type-4 uracil-DNA glycosylase n=1 Tax=Pontivivens ytuae TaxID=2789856 RepID=A0A7S9LTF8_9RHOB|nr:UdgX family uracil-DNA binding protein [Pontivivens ytuae]QPH54992.1 UdgX family uracil-DNA binding protein [Pontivivens ytuae]
MIRVALASETDFDGWRGAARALASNAVPSADVVWQVGEGGLFDTLSDPLPPMRGEVRVPKAFVGLARNVICHRDSERFAKLYRILLCLQLQPGLLAHETDDDIRWLKACDKAIRRDLHKMHAFVRFRKLGERDGREVFASWFEPSHRIEALTADFFVKRFTGMDWAIVTPEARIVWEGGQLSLGPGGTRDEVPEDDAIEDQWKSYFRSIFNPARLKPKAMQAEMPKKYWKNLPEAPLIPELMAEADSRAKAMQDAAPTLPTALTDRLKRGPVEHDIATLEGARKAAAACTRCPLHQDATQTVFGEGPADAKLMIVGEQPGDREDLAGRPFVGPAGELFDRALAEAGMERGTLHLTNAVKHFKFIARGKRRIHQNPSTGEIEMCRWWLDLERELVRPKLILAMGASAARAVLGRKVTIRDARAREEDLGAARLRVTVHPSYLLRLPDDAARAEEYRWFVEDLRAAQARVEALAA